MRGADVVAHVGAIGDVYLAGEQPTLAAEVNVVGTANVFVAGQLFDDLVVRAASDPAAETCDFLQHLRLRLHGQPQRSTLMMTSGAYLPGLAKWPIDGFSR